MNRTLFLTALVCATSCHAVSERRLPSKPLDGQSITGDSGHMPQRDTGSGLNNSGSGLGDSGQDDRDPGDSGLDDFPPNNGDAGAEADASIRPNPTPPSEDASPGQKVEGDAVIDAGPIAQTTTCKVTGLPLSPTVQCDAESCTTANLSEQVVQATCKDGTSTTFGTHQFTKEWPVPTTAATGMTTFTSGGDLFLVAANLMEAQPIGHNTNSTVYKWTGTEFATVQSIPTHGAWGVDSFESKGATYLVAANNHNGVTGVIDSKVYRWTLDQFEEVQSLPTLRAANPNVFKMNGITHMVISFQWDDTSNSELAPSALYRWTDAGFEAIQDIGSVASNDSCHFNSGGQDYLVLVSNRNGIGPGLDFATVYKWETTKLVSVQEIPTDKALHCHAMQIGDEPYVIIPNYLKTSEAVATESPVYKWDGTKLVPHQVLPVNAARGLDSFMLGDHSYLAVTQYRRPEDVPNPYLSDTNVYKWTAGRFEKTQGLAGKGPIGVHSFVFEGRPALAVSNYYDGAKLRVNSAVFR